MGYFSNGTEGELYRERYCERCLHDDPEGPYCPVWEAHLAANYDALKPGNELAREVLDTLIPRTGNGGNGECQMFASKALREAKP